jgi:hypothetical protein
LSEGKRLLDTRLTNIHTIDTDWQIGRFSNTMYAAKWFLKRCGTLKYFMIRYITYLLMSTETMCFCGPEIGLDPRNSWRTFYSWTVIKSLSQYIIDRRWWCHVDRHVMHSCPLQRHEIWTLILDIQFIQLRLSFQNLEPNTLNAQRITTYCLYRPLNLKLWFPTIPKACMIPITVVYRKVLRTKAISRVYRRN